MLRSWLHQTTRSSIGAAATRPHPINLNMRQLKTATSRLIPSPHTSVTNARIWTRLVHTRSSLSSISNDLLLSVSMNVQCDQDAQSQSEMCAQLESNGVIKTARVLECMKSVDRAFYARLPFGTPITKELAAETSDSPYKHGPSPIGQLSTISSPYSHAIALEILEPYLRGDAHVLDVGSGSGYLTACFAQLVAGSCATKDGGKGQVIALEHSSVLLQQSKLNIEADPQTTSLIDLAGHGGGGIWFIRGDANDTKNEWYSTKLAQSILPPPIIHHSGGLSPFDVIHVGVAFPTIPLHFLRILKVGGHMLVPIGRPGSQHLTLIEKLSENETEGIGYKATKVMACSYAGIAAQPPAADIDTINPILRDRAQVEAQLGEAREKLSEWQSNYIQKNNLTRKPSASEMQADPIAAAILAQVAPLRKKKAALDRIVERYQKQEAEEQ